MNRSRRISPGQERLWFLNQLNGASALYNEYACARISGPFHLPAIHQALATICERHESLRWSIQEDRGSCCAIANGHRSSEWLHTVDLDGLQNEQAREQAYQHAATEATLRPFHLEAGPLWRVFLFRLSMREFAIIIIMHHIISDAHSLDILVQEFCRIYDSHCRGTPHGLPPVDYSTRYFFSSCRDEDLQYWVKKLADAPIPVSLPTHRRRPAVRTFAGAKKYFSLPGEITFLIRSRLREAHVTPFVYLLALWTAYLGTVAGAHDLVVGTTIAGRQKDAENLVGFFVNTLAVRTPVLATRSFAQHLQTIRTVALEALDHRDARFEQVVQALRLPRRSNRQPLFEVMFTYVNNPVLELKLPGIRARLTPEDVNHGYSKFDLILSFWDNDESIGGLFDYSLELYDTSEIATHISTFKAFASGAASHPDRALHELIPAASVPVSLVAELRST